MQKLDIFNHIMPLEIFEQLQVWVPGHPIANLFKGVPALWDLDEHRRVMDQFEDYRQVLSLSNPPLETLGDGSVTPEIAVKVNDALAAVCERHPDRFPAFIASLPMNNPDAAAREAERAVRDLDARGVQVFTNVNDVPLSDPRFFPVFETMAGLDLPVWVHPMRLANHPDYATEDQSEAEIWFTFGWPYETAACITRLIYSGIYDKLPNLKIISHHMGGVIPYFAGKVDLGFSQVFTGTVDHNPAQEKFGLKQQPAEYFKLLYGDTATNGSLPAMQCGHAFFTTERSLFATDAPFDPLGGAHLIDGTIKAVDGLDIPDNERELIYYGNAAALLKLA
ncbi:MAG: amidohydrolase family protein [Alphaproteobacteria bacterium]|nr:amidohydrolase family protein [Alphaproteobacteria bacterium]